MSDAAFQQEQRDFAALVERVGYDAIPLNNEKWRPLMQLLWRTSKLEKLRVWTFDMPEHPDRLYQGLMPPLARAKKIADSMKAEMLNLYSMLELEAAMPRVLLANPATLYFEGVWTPKDALPSRRH